MVLERCRMVSGRCQMVSKRFPMDSAMHLVVGIRPYHKRWLYVLVAKCLVGIMSGW